MLSSIQLKMYRCCSLLPPLSLRLLHYRQHHHHRRLPHRCYHRTLEIMYFLSWYMYYMCLRLGFMRQLPIDVALYMVTLSPYKYFPFVQILPTSRTSCTRLVYLPEYPLLLPFIIVDNTLSNISSSYTLSPLKHLYITSTIHL